MFGGSKEVGDGELGGADGVGQVYVEEGEAGGGGAVAGGGCAGWVPEVGPRLFMAPVSTVLLAGFEALWLDVKWSGAERIGLTGSYTPAPGQTISAPPNSLSATENISPSCCQSLTSVFWNTALAGDRDAFWCPETSSWASGRSARSAKTTLHCLLRRTRAKERLRPAKKI